jgi:hypothetical protein
MTTSVLVSSVSAPAVRVLRVVVTHVVRLPRYLLIGLFRVWQLLVSPTYGQTCRFYPSCSAYGVEAVRTHGAVKGLALTVWRILRCNPWNRGGVDPVPHPKSLHEAPDPAVEPVLVAVTCSDDSAPPTRRAA